jgi:hypothetical protein
MLILSQELMANKTLMQTFLTEKKKRFDGKTAFTHNFFAS